MKTREIFTIHAPQNPHARDREDDSEDAHVAIVREMLDVVAARPELSAVLLALAAYATVAQLVPLTGRPSDPALAMLAVLVFALLSRRA